ncbi:MAG: nuclear transport factor 2 family protein [Anaeromyxobacteraceae bacterium]
MPDAPKVALAFAVAAVALARPGLAGEPSEASLRAADAEQMRIIVEGDAEAQRAFMHDHYILNGPSNRVLRKAVLVDMLARGKMASERFERVIEGIAITGNVGIVMGRETVQPRAGSELAGKFGTAPLERRFTNVFLFEGERWSFLARQASVIQAPGR